jgi:hypothetical protein
MILIKGVDFLTQRNSNYKYAAKVRLYSFKNTFISNYPKTKFLIGLDDLNLFLIHYQFIKIIH